MKRTLLICMTISTLMLTACAGGMPQLLWKTGDHTPDYAHDGGHSAVGENRPPLDVPPELRKDISVPMPGQVASDPAQGAAAVNRDAKAAVAGKAVALNSRVYSTTPAQIFSATVDAMTSLNIPVQSVDSPSGVITSDWIRPNANSTNVYAGAVLGMFGAGPIHIRYRFIVRVFRLKNGQSELQIRTLGQQFISNHWVNKRLKKKVYLELFSAVEERLAGLKKIDKSKQTPSSTTAPATIQ